MLFTIQRAVYYYYDRKDIWYELVRRACGKTIAGKSANKYVELYSSIM